MHSNNLIRLLRRYSTTYTDKAQTSAGKVGIWWRIQVFVGMALASEPQLA
jgi:hypothetical protein